MSDLINTNRLHVSAEQAMTSPTESGTPRTDAVDVDPAPYPSLSGYLDACIEAYKDLACQLERELAEKQAEAKHYKFAADSCASFSAVVIAERDALQAALTAERQRAEGLEKLITDHNNACQDLCGRGDQEAVRCKYRPYFETSGRRCPECPTHNIIDFVPSDAALAAGQEEGK